jgi:hypothetical protein
MSTIDHILDDNEVTVEFNYTPPCKGSHGNYGLQMEPDEPADIELIEIKDVKGNIIDIDSLDKKVISVIEEACFNYLTINDHNDKDYD